MRKAQEKGFKVHLYFVALADPELNKRRVQTRIAQGGHPVAEEKIIERYRLKMTIIECLWEILNLEKMTRTCSLSY